MSNIPNDDEDLEDIENDIYNIFSDLWFKLEEEYNIEETKDIKDYDTEANVCFREIIKNLSQRSECKLEDLKIIIEKMEQFYNKNYRHSYYIIYQIIEEISETPIDLETLTTNMDYLYQEVKSSYQGREKLQTKFRKLYDYVMLESVRKTKQVHNLEKINKAVGEYEEIQKKIDIEERKLENITNKLREAESGFINHLLSVLGIFSGVIIAFFGGLQYLGSVFANISNISKYRLLFMTLLVGFIIFNSISMMMILLAKIINRPIYSKCKTENCSCEKKCKPIKRIKKRLSLLYYINRIFIILMVIVFILWALSNKIRLPI